MQCYNGDLVCLIAYFRNARPNEHIDHMIMWPDLQKRVFHIADFEKCVQVWYKYDNLLQCYALDYTNYNKIFFTHSILSKPINLLCGRSFLQIHAVMYQTSWPVKFGLLLLAALTHAVKIHYTCWLLRALILPWLDGCVQVLLNNDLHLS